MTISRILTSPNKESTANNLNFNNFNTTTGTTKPNSDLDSSRLSAFDAILNKKAIEDEKRNALDRSDMNEVKVETIEIA